MGGVQQVALTAVYGNAAGGTAAQARHGLVVEQHREGVAAGAAGHAGCQGARARPARRQVVGGCPIC